GGGRCRRIPSGVRTLAERETVRPAAPERLSPACRAAAAGSDACRDLVRARVAALPGQRGGICSGCEEKKDRQQRQRRPEAPNPSSLPHPVSASPEDGRRSPGNALRGRGDASTDPPASTVSSAEADYRQIRRNGNLARRGRAAPAREERHGGVRASQKGTRRSPQGDRQLRQ